MINKEAKNSKEITVIKGLTNEVTVTELLEKFCNENINKVKTIETYDCNNEHTGIIVEARNKITDEIHRIIIDAVVGSSRLSQIHETVYRRGANCDKRIILYTESLAKRDDYDRMDDDVIKNLAANLNGYGTNIFVFILEESFHEKNLFFELMVEPLESPKYNLSDLPSEAKLKEEEFWEIYYWRHMECFYKPWETFTYEIHEHRDFGHWFGAGGVDVYAKWTEEGIFFEAKDATENSECLDPIWNTRKYDIQALFPDAEVTFHMKPGKLPKLLIKFLPTPVKFLLDASISEKENLANEIFKEFYNFMEFMEYALDDIDNCEIDRVNDSIELAKTE